MLHVCWKFINVFFLFVFGMECNLKISSYPKFEMFRNNVFMWSPLLSNQRLVPIRFKDLNSATKIFSLPIVIFPSITCLIWVWRQSLSFPLYSLLYDMNVHFFKIKSIKLLQWVKSYFYFVLLFEQTYLHREL